MEKTTAVSTVGRKGDWFVTFSGKRFFPLDPRVEDIDIKDIAHALALQTRWMGHCKNFYSIAAHSLACARIAETDDGYDPRVEGSRGSIKMKWALMHDAAEAYTGDIVRPIKRSLYFRGEQDAAGVWMMHKFKDFEQTLLQCIAERFNLPWPIPQEVLEIDNRMLVTEAVHLTNYDGGRYVDGERHWIYEKPWVDVMKPYGDNHVLVFLAPEEAERRFLARANEYLGL